MRRPEKQAFAVMLVLILSPLAWSGDSDLKLNLESNVRTLRLRQKATLKLRITGVEVSRITEGTEGVTFSNAQTGSFVYGFDFEPQREGQFTFGPYTLSFNGRTLTSNCVSLFVLPLWDGPFGTLFRTDSTNITLGDKIELTMETRSAGLDHKYCQFKRDETFTWELGGTASMFTGGLVKDSQVCYLRTWWWITPKRPGAFKITRDLFASFPEGIEAPDLTVTVREPAQKK